MQDAQHITKGPLAPGRAGRLVIIRDAHARQLGRVGDVGGLFAAEGQGGEAGGDGAGFAEAGVAEEVGEVPGVPLEGSEVDAVGEVDLGLEGVGRLALGVCLARTGLGGRPAGGSQGRLGRLEGHVEHEVAFGGDGDDLRERIGCRRVVILRGLWGLVHGRISCVTYISIKVRDGW